MNLYYTLMSRDGTNFRNYFSTITLISQVISHVIDADRRPLSLSSEYYCIELNKLISGSHSEG